MSTPMPYTPERIDAEIAGAQRRLVEARAFRSDVDQLRGHARSRDGSVRVSVDASGLVLGLELTDPLPPARDLQRELMEQIRAAQRDVAAKARATATERFGATSPVVARLDEELTTRFAERDPDGTTLSDGGRPDLGRGSRWLR